MKRRFLVALAVIALIAAIGSTAAYAGPKWPVPIDSIVTAQ